MSEADVDKEGVGTATVMSDDDDNDDVSDGDDADRSDVENNRNMLWKARHDGQRLLVTLSTPHIML